MATKQPKNKAYFWHLGNRAARDGATCPYKGGWQRKAWMEGYDAGGMSSRARAEAAAKAAKARMMAAHPDHGGTCEAFRAAHAAWKLAERRAAMFN